MKKFVYQVKGYEVADATAFGEAWKAARKTATELHCPIFRTVIRGEQVKQEVFVKGGLFLNVELAKPADYLIF